MHALVCQHMSVISSVLTELFDIAYYLSPCIEQYRDNILQRVFESCICLPAWSRGNCVNCSLLIIFHKDGCE